MKFNKLKQDNGITLIALIITIIVIVILAAVSIKAVYDSGIVDLAISGAGKYAEEQQKELDAFAKAEEIIENSKLLFTPSIFITGTQISGEVYTGEVEVVIEDSASVDATGATKLWYDVTNEAGDSLISGPIEVDGRSATVNVTVEGKITVTAWVENEDKKSAEATKTFTIDNSAPGNPSILLTGTIGENGYYVSDVDVTISAGEAGSSGIRGIKYKVEGATSVPETEEAGTEVTLRITNDGETKVTAYVVGNTGALSNEMSQTFNKDTVAPSAEMTVTNYDTETITVSTNVADSLSRSRKLYT